jgi:acyl dehydratase
MLESLPQYIVKAVNTSTDSENKIHDDATARRYGFGGGLVPGVTVYAYITQPLVAAFGSAWLQRGTASVKFVKPVLDGEEVTVTGEITARDPQSGITAVVRATTASTGECPVATATVPARAPTPLNVALYAEAPLPAERGPGTRAYFDAHPTLGTFGARYDAVQAEDYVATVRDPLPLYRGADGWVHPAFFAHMANRCLRTNVIIGPWIHAGSVVRHLGGARVGAALSARARVRSLWEKKGRDFVELDIALLASGRPVAHVLHTAIYRLPVPEESTSSREVS